MNFPNKKSKSIDISFPNKLFPKIKIRQCMSLPNIKCLTNKKYLTYEKEEIGYMVDQSLENDNISNIKSFENYTNNKNKITNILDAFDYEQCLTTNSKHNLNTSRNIINKDINVDKMKEIFNNNKEYIIVPKLKNKNKNKLKGNLTSNIINNNILMNNNSENIFTDNNDSNYNNILYNNYKTYEFNNKEINTNTTQKISFDEISIVSKINTLDDKENINITEEDDYFLKDNNDIQSKNNINNHISKYKLIIYKLNKEKLELEENVSKAILTNNELKNYIEILKQTIENYIIKSGYKDIMENISKELDKSPISLLTEFTKYKLENEKIKKNMLMQQVISTEMKEEIENIKKENEKLININKQLKEENEKNINNNLNINNDLINCLNNNDDYECLKNLSKINKELNQNYLNLQNDFAFLSQNNEDIIKYNEKLIKENEELKKEINYIHNKNSNTKNNENDSLCNKDIVNNNEMNKLINKIGDLENNNMELNMIINKQKNEIENMNNIISIKDNEIIQYNNEIQEYKKKEYNNINESIKNNQEILSLQNKIKNIEQIINEIFENQIKQENNIYPNNNSEDKIKYIKNFLEKLIKDISILNQKLIEKNKNERNNKEINKKNIFTNLKEDRLINFKINSIIKYNNDNIELKDKPKENIFNYNSNIIRSSFEEYSIIKQKENQNNSNNDLFFSNNNLVINKDIGEYTSMIDKLNNLLSIKNKINNNNEDNNQLLYDTNKTSIHTPSNDIIKKSQPKNNKMNKSFSTKIIKNDNTFNDIFINKNEKTNKEKIKTELIGSKKNLDLEKEKINNIQKNIQKNSLITKNKEENKNDLYDNFYITMPYKFTKIENNFSMLKKNQSKSKTNYLNNSNYMKNTKYSQGSQTIDSSSRMFTSNINSNNNEYSFKNKNNVCTLKKYKNIQNYANNNEKNIKDKHSFAEEVLKPTFLKSDVSSTLFNYYHSNPVSNKNNSNNNSKLSYEILYKNLNYL